MNLRDRGAISSQKWSNLVRGSLVGLIFSKVSMWEINFSQVHTWKNLFLVVIDKMAQARREKSVYTEGRKSPAYVVTVPVMIRNLSKWMRTECLTIGLSLCSPSDPPSLLNSPSLSKCIIRKFFLGGHYIKINYWGKYIKCIKYRLRGFFFF